ncbi:tetratricopeptide repeat protein [Chloroflexi bacterium TSY]|nr:tetratricopeptide repeat protein [Chloroflexi bacterium TSY]
MAEADLATLTGFVDRSLLHWNPSGRYQIHELLRQYAADRLTHTPDVLIDSCHAHCTYYAALLHQHSLDLHGGKQLEAAADIEDDLDNIRAAWAWALQHKRLSDLRQMLNPVGNYFQLRGRYLDGIQMLEMALAELDETDPAAQENLALLLVGLAWYALRLGQIERVQSLSKQSMAIYKRADLPLPLPDSHTTDPALTLGSAAAVLGHYDEAASYFQQALQRSQNRAAFAGNEQTARYQLAKVAVAQGDFATAQTHAQAAFAVAEKIQDHWFMAYCHLVLGHVAQQLGKWSLRVTIFKQAMICETFGDAEEWR